MGAKGWQVGKAQVSEQHANFIVNLGEATSKDILNLMDLIQKAVKKEYGVTLEPEIIFLGMIMEKFIITGGNLCQDQ